MTRSKGKLVALAAVLVGIATLGVAGFASRDRIVEEYYIWKLNSKDPWERKSAAEKLGAMRSVRAVHALLEAMIRNDYGPAIKVSHKIFRGVRSAPLSAMGAIGRPALPPLSAAFDRGDPWISAAYLSLIMISGESEGLEGDVDALLFKVKKDSTPSSAVHTAAIDLIPKVKAFRSRTPQALTFPLDGQELHAYRPPNLWKS